MAATLDIVHATCVAIDGRGVLICGASGAGKSALALQLIALGAALVADDRTQLNLKNDRLVASPPATIRGMIEARGVGILNAPVAEEVEPVLVVDLDQEETERLPPRRETGFLGQSLPLLWRVDGPHFPAAIVLLVRHGRTA